MLVSALGCLEGMRLGAASDYVRVYAATSASTVYGLIQTHPNDPNRPLVDFDLALTFIPALLLGVSFGVRPWCKR